MTTTTTDWLRRVQALISKAESTTHPAEADALLAKAQDLMTRHAIDDAMLASSKSKQTGSPVTTEKVRLDAPYASTKAQLIGMIGLANSVRTVILRDNNVQLVGYASDIEATKMLYASIALQGAREMARTPVPPHDTPRRFRYSFMLAFANRIGQRLREAAAETIRSYEAETGTSTALVLSSKADAVEARLRELYPSTRKKRMTASSRSGWSSGRTAADRAQLGQQGIAGGNRKTLSA